MLLYYVICPAVINLSLIREVIFVIHSWEPGFYQGRNLTYRWGPGFYQGRNLPYRWGPGFYQGRTFRYSLGPGCYWGSYDKYSETDFFFFPGRNWVSFIMNYFNKVCLNEFEHIHGRHLSFCVLIVFKNVSIFNVPKRTYREVKL